MGAVDELITQLNRKFCGELALSSSPDQLSEQVFVATLKALGFGAGITQRFPRIAGATVPDYEHPLNVRVVS